MASDWPTALATQRVLLLEKIQEFQVSRRRKALSGLSKFLIKVYRTAESGYAI